MAPVNKMVIFVLGMLLGVGLTLAIFYGTNSFEQTILGAEKSHEIKFDTVYIEQKPEVKIERVIEQTSNSNDTVMLLTNINQSVDSGDYVVLRDKLLLSQRIRIIKNSQSQTQSASDKLVDKMNSDDFFSEQIVVEFWESPIDYQGYRLNKTKLVLFGINPNENFLLTQTELDALLMQTGDFSVVLRPTEKYRSYFFQ
jgi:hypothetical protein